MNHFNGHRLTHLPAEISYKEVFALVNEHYIISLFGDGRNYAIVEGLAPNGKVNTKLK